MPNKFTHAVSFLYIKNMSKVIKIFADEKGKVTIAEKEDGIKLIEIKPSAEHFAPIKN